MTWNNAAVADPPDPRRWAAFAVVLLASVMDLLDSLVTNIAGPTIRADIGGGPELIQWLGAGYTLAMAAGLMVGGRLGDIHGRKPVFLTGAAGFTLASVLCACATSPGELIGFRVAQGLFGAVMLPQGLGVIKAVFPPQELARAFGAFGPAMGLSTVVGPVLAGTLIDADLFHTGWRMVFLINLPLGLVALYGGFRYLPGGRLLAGMRLDPAGAVIAAGAALMVVYPVVQGRSLGWPAWTIAMAAGSLVLFGLFGYIETRIHRNGGDPLVVPTVFRKRSFSGGLATGLVFFAALVGFSLVLTLFVQIGLGYSPLKAGLAALPQAIGSVVGFVVAGVGLADKLGRRLLHLGLACMGLGVAGTYLAFHAAGTALTPWDLAPSLLFTGAGMGMFLAPFFDIVLAAVEPDEYGSASGTLNAVQQFAGAVGVAILGTVFFGLAGGHVGAAVDHQAPALRARLSAAGVAPADRDAIVADLRGCEVDRSTASDPSRVPASCAALRGAVVRAGAAHGASVGAEVGSVASDAAGKGFSTSVQETIWTVMGLLAAAFVLTFTLPRRAAPQGDRTDWDRSGGGDGADGGDGAADREPHADPERVDPARSGRAGPRQYSGASDATGQHTK
ncbi:MFS transporter [Streptomyces sp. HPF1205]|uniref:MFS transporter n=1 Tax=Streptomyces sp. HPF1205 TaxID=2873262 RepID=UPI001CECD5DC|nr:MFS transporter [Streptomyces sp. HPF1205]